MTNPPLPLTSKHLLILPWLVLLIGLSLTGLIWEHERQNSRKEVSAQFDFALRETVSRIEQRVAAYEQTLRGVQSLLATTPLNNRKAIHDYVESLQLDANFSGIRVIGIVEHVPLPNRADHIAAMQQHGFTDYVIHPEGERETYTPVIQREPYINSKHAPLGLDVWGDPIRRQAMEKARDAGMAAITAKVRLGVDTEADAAPGFVMYLPIFAPEQPRDSVAQRRAHLIGWVFASFRMRDFMASLYGKQSPGLTLSIYDDVDPTEAALIYRSAETPENRVPVAANTPAATEYMVVAGHTWTLSLSPQKAFDTRYLQDPAWIIAVTGLGLSLSLALLIWQMITGRVRAQRLAAEMTEELRHIAQHDPLTKLPNRALFSDRLNHELARAKRHDGRFALVFIDLDNFKPINDNYGHAVGDRLLQKIAERLQSAMRASDTVGRIGGDEFVVLMVELTEANDALGLAEKIRRTVRQPMTIDQHELVISCSLGVAVYPGDGTDEITLTKSADEAMYGAKESGRDSVRLAT